MSHPTINDIKAPIADELIEFNQRFKDSMKSLNVPLVDKVMRYIVKRKGKQMRPMFVLLLNKAVGGQVTDAGYVGASLIELLHTATLVHDDVVDEADTRRGFFSINALWGKKVAVLVGDYLLSRGLLLSLRNKQFRLLELTSRAVEAMSEGELLQLEKARRLDITEEVYYDIINKKTASLIAASCAVGTASATDDEELINQMWRFGELAGIAFQIRDDLFDFGFDDVGKPLGIDIKEKKMTLPLIYALQHVRPSEVRRIKRLIRKKNTDPKAVQEVIEFVRQSGGLEYAAQEMMKYREQATEILDQLPNRPATEALRQLLKYVTERKK